MRIMHVLNHTFIFNGHVHVAVDLACVQAQMGHDLAIVSGGGDFDALLAQNSVRHIVIDQRRQPLNLIKATLAFGRAFAEFRPEIVHAHMMTSTGLAWPWRKLRGFRLITTVHNEFERSAIIMGLGDRVIAVSDAVRASMRLRGIRGGKLRVVLNGTLGSPRLPGTKPAAAALKRPAIVFVGGLHPRKGVDELIRAFDLVRLERVGPTLYIVGDGPNRAEYEALAHRLGCGDSVQFCGQASDPRPYLLGSDIFVLASRADPAPLVITEAREAGCAIVATAVDGIPELLDHGEAGILVPPGDCAALASAITSLLGNPQTLARMRQRSQGNLERMSVARVAEETLGIYREALAPPHSVPAKHSDAEARPSA
jgi:glycosyltransferase involved in cell wall biosynthesis